jgi:transposase
MTTHSGQLWSHEGGDSYGSKAHGVRDGRPVGQTRAAVAESEASTDTRSTTSGFSSRLGGHPVGASQRCTLEGSAGLLPITLHLLAAASRLGRARSVASDLADLPGRTGRTGTLELERGVCRRDVLARQKRGACVGKTKRGKGTKCLVVADGQGVPLGVLLASASPAEVKLLEPALQKVSVPRSGAGHPRNRPERLILDRGYDSDALRIRIERRGIQFICPHRKNRTRPSRQDGRPLRRYRRRWIIERTIAWLGNFRRLLVRWERNAKIYRAFLHVACIMITLRQF